jgi:hypothetical protein
MGNPLVRFCEGLGGNPEIGELPCLLDNIERSMFDVLLSIDHVSAGFTVPDLSLAKPNRISKRNHADSEL